MDHSLIYFNNAATSWPKPKQVINKVIHSLQMPYHEHGRATDENLIDYPRKTRELLCNFFNAYEPKHFIFTSNATDSLNLLIHGYIMHKNEKIHVITTELEHNSVLRPLNTLQRNGIIDLSIVPFNSEGYVSLETIKQAIQINTKLVVFNHGSNVLGTVQDIQCIGSYLKENEIFFIVDAAQTAGHIHIDLQKTSLDGLVFTGHKALYGYPGIGGFYISNPKLVDSYKQGGTGVYSQYPFHPEEMPLKFEFGTHNYPGIVSLYAGLQFIQNTNMKVINIKTHKMTMYIINELKYMENIVMYNTHPDLPIISFNIDGIDQDDVGFILQKQFHIMTRTGLHCAPLVHKKIDNGKGCIRVSLSYYNTMDECIKFVEAVRKIVQSTIVETII